MILCLAEYFQAEDEEEEKEEEEDEEEDEDKEQRAKRRTGMKRVILATTEVVPVLPQTHS